jgi:hypothetical protein
LLSAYTADEVLSAESKAQLAGERDVIGREAADVRVAIEASQNAIRRLTELYGDGVINSPVTGSLARCISAKVAWCEKQSR